MCGRYGRRGDKQKIAEAFNVKGGLDEVDFGEDLDCAPIQPVVWMNEEGERVCCLWRKGPEQGPSRSWTWIRYKRKGLCLLC
jgi:hypothetical protein